MIVNSLSAHPCFRTLDAEACRILDRHCVWLETAAGGWVVAEESANDRGVYFVMTGLVRAVHAGTKQDPMSSEMEAGSFFGELGALEGAPRLVNVFALKNSTIARMPRPVFVETMFAHRPLGEAVVATLVARNRAMTRKVAEAAHLDGDTPLHFSSAQSRPSESGFDPDVGLRRANANHGRARRW